LLAEAAALRADGFSIALDDVGARPDSLALLDILCPDIIELDMEMVRSHPSDDQTRTLAAVLAHQERTGACCSSRASNPPSISNTQWPWARR
jgi:EAL domain-containing protein (putative c-di-GMP-specific phosphodiesterase class I)